MGYGDYSLEAHQAITAARSAQPAQQVFSQRSVHPLMIPKGKVRESRDSPDHPHTTSIVFALDVSGSMGAIPEQIARKELPGFMKTLLDSGVRDPQVLFMALHDAASPEGPLQVGQFESTAELIDRWLTWTWLIGGGASAFESYDLAFWFAAHHLELDSLEKRQKRGYLFMTGDEPCYDKLDRGWVKTYLGDDVGADVPLEEVIAQAKRTVMPFFLVPDPGRFQNVGAFWTKHLGTAAIGLAAPEDTCPVAASLVAIAEGAIRGTKHLRERLRETGYDAARADRIVTSIAPWAADHGTP